MAPADTQEKDWAKEGSATTCSVVDGVLAEARYGNSWCVSTVLKVGANDHEVRWHHEASEAAVTFDEVRPKDRDTINVGWEAAVRLCLWQAVLSRLATSSNPPSHSPPSRVEHP